jgi:peptidoglycan hydrolase-like protein with peptidoglycan-binding domain
MTRTMTLIVAGLLAAGSATALSAQQQQQQTPPTKPTQTQPAKTMTPAHSRMARPTTGMRGRAHRWTVEQIKDAQTGLTAAKLYTGRVSGVYDSATRTAVREFQRAHNLPVTGNLSDSLLVMLRQEKPKP